MQELIDRIEVKCIKVPLKEPFVIATGSRDFHTSVILKVITNSGTEGFGEAVPSKAVLDETIEDTYEFGNTYLEDQLKGMDAWDRHSIMKKLQKLNSPQSMKNAVDNALFDIEGKLVNQPVYRLLGGSKAEIETSATVDIKNMKETERIATQLIKDGFKVIKIKVGLNLQEDISRVKLVRELSKDIKIRIDANQGYTVDEAINFAKSIEKINIEFIEQPVDKLDISGLKKVKQNSPIKIMADESVKTLEDALKLIRLDAVDLLNIKITKAGGIEEGKRIADIAKSAGIETMLGSMLGTGLLISAAYNLFAGTGNIRYADLDGFIWLKETPIEGGVFIKNGMLKITDGPGLAIKTVNIKKFECDSIL